MRASPQDLVHVYALATVAPVDLSDFYVSAAVATIYPGLRFLSVDEVFNNQECIVVRANKTIQELGLDLPQFLWSTLDDCYGHAYTFYHKGLEAPYLPYAAYAVYCKETFLRAFCGGDQSSIWENMLLRLDDEEYLVIHYLCDTVLGVIKLPA